MNTIALTIWGNRISPVFDSARTLLVAEIRDKSVIQKKYESFNAKNSTLSDRLRELGISTLICGAISKIPANMITSSGIILIPFITGNTEEILKLYLNQSPIPERYFMPGCKKYVWGNRPETSTPDSNKRSIHNPMKILLISEDAAPFSTMIDTFKNYHFQIDIADSGSMAIKMLADNSYTLLIADEKLTDLSSRALIEQTIIHNPMMNCVAVSSLAHKAFHDAFEGLGVLMQFPPSPAKEDVENLIRHLDKIRAISRQHPEEKGDKTQ